MKKAILATKVGMTQIFNEDGMLIPVTVLQAGPCVVTQVKTDENDGYTAVQVGFGDIREKLVNKPETGHFAKAGVAVKRFVKEFRFENAAEYEVGQEIKADIFADGDHIDATAVSKGKGFQGAIKRHGQSRARAIAKDPEIFIFDDSFSALDFKTDSQLRKALKEYTKDATTVIVAQRISTILGADQIIVLDDGHMAGIGTHKELMANCEVYQQIARSQLSEEELA